MTYTLDNFYGKNTSHLVEVKEFKNCMLTSETALAFKKMHDAALKDHLDLVPISSFRSFDRQLKIWNEKYLGERKVLDNHNQEINIQTLTGIEAAYAILYWSALPGFSRHHWGTDLDVIAQNLLPEGYELQLISSEYEDGGIFAPLTDWLNEHMEEFGFYRPFTDQAKVRVGSELWHISYKPEADRFLPFVTKENIENLIRNSAIAGKYCLLNLVDELYDDYIINESNKDLTFKA